ILPDRVGSFDYVFRFSTTAGRNWVYADQDGIFSGTPNRAGSLRVNASADTTAPVTPVGLTVTSASALGVDLAWQPITDDATVYGYEVARSDAPAGPLATIALVTEPSAHDPDISGTAPISYVVRAIDTSFN